MQIKDIKVGKRFRKDLGNIQTLSNSVQEVGLLHPIVINEKNQLIAGQRRLEAFKQLGRKDIPTTTVNLSDLARGEFHENIVRKSFTFNERNEIRKEYKPKLEKEAEQRKKSGRPSGNFPEGGDTRDNMANYFGISGKTNDKEERIAAAVEANPEQFGDLPEKIDSGETSVDYADKMVRRAEEHKKENIPELPQGTFDIILADPPWKYDINTRGSPDEHYVTMTDTQIQNLEIPSAKNAILFLWGTAPKLQEALKVMKEWGFKYKTNAVWIKDRIGNGHYFRGQHELLLVGEKGDMPLPQEKDRVSSVIEAPRTKHSEKPEQVYNTIESMYPNRSYLELFARRERKGWTSWGNELK